MNDFMDLNELKRIYEIYGKGISDIVDFKEFVIRLNSANDKSKKHIKDLLKK